MFITMMRFGDVSADLHWECVCFAAALAAAILEKLGYKARPTGTNYYINNHHVLSTGHNLRNGNSGLNYQFIIAAGRPGRPFAPLLPQSPQSTNNWATVFFASATQQRI